MLTTDASHRSWRYYRPIEPQRPSLPPPCLSSLPCFTLKLSHTRAPSQTEDDAAELRNALRETSAQRDGFRKTAEQLGEEVMRLREQVGTYGARLSATEHAHNEARSQWAAKIEQAEVEFSQDMLTKEDLEAMRVQIIEQAEAPLMIHLLHA